MSGFMISPATMFGEDQPGRSPNGESPLITLRVNLKCCLDSNGENQINSKAFNFESLARRNKVYETCC